MRVRGSGLGLVVLSRTLASCHRSMSSKLFVKNPAHELMHALIDWFGSGEWLGLGLKLGSGIRYR